MSIILEFTPEEGARLQVQAARHGQSADALARTLFRRGLDLEDVPAPQELTTDAVSGQTLADTLQQFIGIVESCTTQASGDLASENLVAFNNILAEKARR